LIIIRAPNQNIMISEGSCDPVWSNDAEYVQY